VFDRSVSNPRLAYVTSGIQRAAEEAGAKLLLVDDTEDRRLYVAQSIRDAAFLKETLVARLALECDSLVNCPIAKSHGEAGLTLALKNLMGVTGDNRGRWHWQLDDAIADINRLVRSTLTLVDASSIMLRGGPTGGSPANLRRMDTFIAGTNPVSTDAEAAKLFGMRASDLPYIAKAAEAGIGRAAGYTVRSAGTR
jgi:uncharacterized protein (DUF362 family)